MTLLIHTPEGRITQTVNEPAPASYVEDMTSRGILVVRHDDGGQDIIALLTTMYVEGGKVAPRPTIDATVSKTAIRADGADKAVISGLPTPCIVRVDGQPVERKGGTLTLTADVPATYRIEVDQWPYLPWSAEIVAT